MERVGWRLVAAGILCAVVVATVGAVVVNVARSGDQISVRNDLSRHSPAIETARHSDAGVHSTAGEHTESPPRESEPLGDSQSIADGRRDSEETPPALAATPSHSFETTSATSDVPIIAINLTGASSTASDAMPPLTSASPLDPAGGRPSRESSFPDENVVSADAERSVSTGRDRASSRAPADEAEVVTSAPTAPEARLPSVRREQPRTTVRKVALSARELLDAPILAHENPFDHALRWAAAGHEHIERDVHDYTCTLVRRERVHGVLSDYQYALVKVRHERSTDNGLVPFGIYMKFVAPSDVQGREVLYVRGENDDHLIARKGGRRFPYITVEVDPTSDLAMRDNRYPITDFGLLRLVERLIEVAEEEAAINECDVRYLRGAKVDGRACTGIEVTKRIRREQNRFYRARIYIDDEHQVPIHFETYDFPPDDLTPPLMLEQYTYRNLKLNVGLTDEDFDRDNPEYQLTKPSER